MRKPYRGSDLARRISEADHVGFTEATTPVLATKRPMNDKRAKLWNELLDGMEYHCSGPYPQDAEENFLADPGWVEDLEAYCALTDQREADVLPELRGAALAKLEGRER